MTTMQKLGATVFLVIVVIFVYFLMTALQPMTNEMVATANTSANWTNFESTQNAILAYPIYQWFLPGLLGVVGLVIIWRFA